MFLKVLWKAYLLWCIGCQMNVLFVKAFFSDKIWAEPRAAWNCCSVWQKSSLVLRCLAHFPSVSWVSCSDRVSVGIVLKQVDFQSHIWHMLKQIPSLYFSILVFICFFFMPFIFYLLPLKITESLNSTQGEFIFPIFLCLILCFLWGQMSTFLPNFSLALSDFCHILEGIHSWVPLKGFNFLHFNHKAWRWTVFARRHHIPTVHLWRMFGLWRIKDY